MAIAALFAVTALLMIFSGACMAAAREAAAVFCNAVLPALLPMTALAGFLAPRLTPKPWLLVGFGWAAGSPAGARLLRQSGASGLPMLAVWTGVMSPLFFTGTIAQWLGNARAAVTMLVCHWAGAMLLGAGATFFHKSVEKKPSKAPAVREVSFLEVLTSSASAMLTVLMAMMLCAVLSAVLRGGLSALGMPMDGKAAAIVHGLLEIGGGAYDVSRAFENPAALLCGLCSFGGISILLQNLAFLGEEIRPISLLLTRAAHGALSYGLCKIVLPMVCGGQAPVSVAVSAFQPARTALPLWPLALLLVLASLRKSRTC